MGMLKTIFGADTSRLDKGLDKARGRVAKFSKGVNRQLAGAFSVAAITFYFRNLTQRLDRFGKLARRGFSTDFIQDLNQQVEAAGSSVDAVIPKILALYREINNGVEPSKQMRDALDTLGLTVKDLEGLSPEDLFRRVVEAMRQSTDRGRAAAAAMTLLRDRTGELVPVFESLVNDGLRPSARATQEAIIAAEKLNDAWAKASNDMAGPASTALLYVVKVLMWLKAAIEIVGVTIGASVSFWIEYFKNFGKGVRQVVTGDFSGAMDTIKNQIKEVSISFQVLKEGVADVMQGLKDFNAELEKDIKPLTVGGSFDGPTEIEQNVKQKIQPSALADSLQRIGGGGASVVSIQRDESIRLAQGQLEELKGIRAAIQQLESEQMR